MPQKLATEQLAIADWVKGLAAIPNAISPSKMCRTTSCVTPSVRRPLDKYCYFSKGSYTRNLIFKNDLFECMTVCWDIGQHSRIHNHRDQNCWMSAPIGRLRVQNYRVADHGRRSRHLQNHSHRLLTISTPRIRLT